MLLLTAIILLIGFIALSGMVIRVSQLPEETTQESRRPIDLEAGAVAEGVRGLIQRTHERIPVGGASDLVVYNQAMQDSLDSISHMERGRGFRFEWIANDDGDAVTCSEDVDDVIITLAVTVALHDLDTSIQVTIEQTFGEVGEERSCDYVPP